MFTEGKAVDSIIQFQLHKDYGGDILKVVISEGENLLSLSHNYKQIKDAINENNLVFAVGFVESENEQMQIISNAISYGYNTDDSEYFVNIYLQGEPTYFTSDSETGVLTYEVTPII